MAKEMDRSLTFVGVGSLNVYNGYHARVIEHSTFRKKRVNAKSRNLIFFVNTKEYLAYLGFRVRGGPNKNTTLKRFRESFDTVLLCPFGGFYYFPLFSCAFIKFLYLFSKFRRSQIVAEGTAAGFILSFTNLDYHLDLHALTTPEVILRARGKSNSLATAIKCFVARYIDYRCIKYSSQLTVVSSQMRERVSKFDCSEQVEILPCLCNNGFVEQQQRLLNSRRRELGFAVDDIIFGYAGGVGQYQCIPEMLHFFKIYSNFDARFQLLLLLATDIDVFLKKYEWLRNNNRVKVLNVNPVVLHEYVQLMDFGLLIRAEDEVNYLSSPTKFGDYIQCGTQVITTSSVIDCSTLIKSYCLGHVIEFADISSVNQDLLNKLKSYQNSVEDRQKLKEWARDHYTWENYDQNRLSF